MSIRVEDRAVLHPAVAGIAYRKVRSHLLGNQNREFVENAVAQRYLIRSCVGANRKLAHRQRLMVFEDHLFH